MRAVTLLALLLVASAAPAGADQLLKAQTKAWTVADGARLRFHFPVGALRVEPSGDPKVRLDLVVRCKRARTERCERFADRLRLDIEETPRELRVEVEGTSGFGKDGIHLEGHLMVPRGLAVRLEMGVGDLEIEGLAGNLDIDLGVGDATLVVDAADYGAVAADVGVGDASLRAPGRRRSSSGFIGRSVSWNEGHGPSRARLHVGVGEASIRVH